MFKPIFKCTTASLPVKSNFLAHLNHFAPQNEYSNISFHLKTTFLHITLTLQQQMLCPFFPLKRSIRHLPTADA